MEVIHTERTFPMLSWFMNADSLLSSQQRLGALASDAGLHSGLGLAGKDRHPPSWQKYLASTFGTRQASIRHSHTRKRACCFESAVCRFAEAVRVRPPTPFSTCTSASGPLRLSSHTNAHGIAKSAVGRLPAYTPRAAPRPPAVPGLQAVQRPDEQVKTTCIVGGLGSLAPRCRRSCCSCSGAAFLAPLDVIRQYRPTPCLILHPAACSPLAGQGLPRLETQKVFISPYLDRLLQGRAAFTGGTASCMRRRCKGSNSATSISRPPAPSHPLQWTRRTTDGRLCFTFTSHGRTRTPLTLQRVRSGWWPLPWSACTCPSLACSALHAGALLGVRYRLRHYTWRGQKCGRCMFTEKRKALCAVECSPQPCAYLPAAHPQPRRPCAAETGAAMLFNASTTPCNLQCSTIVSNLFCCDEIFLPGLFFKNIYALPRETRGPKRFTAKHGHSAHSAGAHPCCCCCRCCCCCCATAAAAASCLHSLTSAPAHLQRTEAS